MFKIISGIVLCISIALELNTIKVITIDAIYAGYKRNARLIKKSPADLPRRTDIKMTNPLMIKKSCTP